MHRNLHVGRPADPSFWSSCPALRSVGGSSLYVSYINFNIIPCVTLFASPLCVCTSFFGSPHVGIVCLLNQVCPFSIRETMLNWFRPGSPCPVEYSARSMFCSHMARHSFFRNAHLPALVLQDCRFELRRQCEAPQLAHIFLFGGPLCMALPTQPASHAAIRPCCPLLVRSHWGS